MNLLRLKQYSEGVLVYEYQPEGSGEYGEIFFDTKSMRGRLLKKAGEDSDTNIYGIKALSKVEELVQKNNIPLKCTQAWY